jgi:hypothetical protein
MNYYDEPVDLPTLRDFAYSLVWTLIAMFVFSPFVEWLK